MPPTPLHVALRSMRWSKAHLDESHSSKEAICGGSLEQEGGHRAIATCAYKMGQSSTRGALCALHTISLSTAGPSNRPQGVRERAHTIVVVGRGRGGCKWCSNHCPGDKALQQNSPSAGLKQGKQFTEQGFATLHGSLMFPSLEAGGCNRPPMLHW